MSWDGKERRTMDNELRDTIIETRNDVKHLVKTLSDHVIQDDKVQGEIKRDLKFQQKIFYGLIGVVAFIQFIISVNPDFAKTFFK